MSSFQDLGFFIHNNPEATEAEVQTSYAHAALNYQRESIQVVNFQDCVDLKIYYMRTFDLCNLGIS